MQFVESVVEKCIVLEVVDHKQEIIEYDCLEYQN